MVEVMYLPSANKIISTNQQQTKVIQEVVSTEVSKLNHNVLHKERDQMLFSPGKKLDRKKKTDSSQSLSTHHTSRCMMGYIMLYNEVIDSLILQEIFSSV